jgi:hypothetical protein
MIKIFGNLVQNPVISRAVALSRVDFPVVPGAVEALCQSGDANLMQKHVYQ